MPAKLEQTIGLGREFAGRFPPFARLADAFLAAADGRKKSPAYEVRWLNLCGFCLRPGFGFPGDDFRIEQARRVYAGRPALRQPGAERNRLVDLLGPRGRRPEPQPADRHFPAALAVAAAARPARSRSASILRLLREMWRAAASLELLPIGTKTELGDALVARVKAGDCKETESVVPVAAGRAQAVLRADQPGRAARHG